MPDFARLTRLAFALIVSPHLAASFPGVRPYLAVIGKQAGAVAFFAEDGHLSARPHFGISRSVVSPSVALRR
jgi:hypothetical protein